MTKRYWSLGHRIPRFISVPLFGDRQCFGRAIQESDADWQDWQTFYMDFYENTQKRGAGKLVNDAGYRILRSLNLGGKYVVEIGPGVLPHMCFWNGKPAHYAIIDNQQELLERSGNVLEAAKVPYSCHLTDSHLLPVQDGQADVVISFYSLEHLCPLRDFLCEIKRIMRPGGVLIGAIPAEGGIAWGLGRFLTTRRYVMKHTSFSLDKIICWEHPNFADEILTALDDGFHAVRKRYWPSGIPLIDINLVVSFIYRSQVG